ITWPPTSNVSPLFILISDRSPPGRPRARRADGTAGTPTRTAVLMESDRGPSRGPVRRSRRASSGPRPRKRAAGIGKRGRVLFGQRGRARAVRVHQPDLIAVEKGDLMCVGGSDRRRAIASMVGGDSGGEAS